MLEYYFMLFYNFAFKVAISFSTVNVNVLCARFTDCS